MRWGTYRDMGSRNAPVLFLGLLLAACVPVGPVAFPDRVAGPPSRAPTAGCVLPVPAPVSDGFRPPDEPWLPGNRGLDFATVPGQIVRAVAPGVVTFAATIAHHRYVTVRLTDGRDVTYSYLDGTDRTAGEAISIGDPIGITGEKPFHLGHRDDGTYLDPGPLVALACGRGHAVLVPVPP